METQELTLHNELKRKSIFLRDFTTELYASGATTIRIEKNLGRIAESWHTKADFSVLPTCIVLNTVKGLGATFAEGTGAHSSQPSKEQWDEAIAAAEKKLAEIKAQ